MTVHNLKCWSSAFRETVEGRKPYEIRMNDRDYHLGDILRLWEWKPEPGEATGWVCEVTVTSMAQGRWGLPSDICVLGFDPRAATATLTTAPIPSYISARRRP